MKTSNEINREYVEPLSSVIGSSLAQIRAQDDLKYWELEFSNGQVLYFDTMNHGGFFGRVVANDTAQLRATTSVPSTENATGALAAAPCSACDGEATNFVSVSQESQQWSRRGLSLGGLSEQESETYPLQDGKLGMLPKPSPDIGRVQVEQFSRMGIAI